MGKLSVALLGLCTTLSAWAQETPADFTCLLYTSDAADE